MVAPLFSIITASFNAAPTIRQTLESVRDQSFQDFEHIVIDGGSTDGTVEIIREFADWLSHWHSEPDGGIADAMNKGVEKATGKYVLFLHADDYLPDLAALQRCAEKIDGRSDITVFDIVFEVGGKGIRRSTPHPERRLRWKPVPHQGTICKRELFGRIGGFDTSFRICMDYEWTMRALTNRASIKGSPEIIAVMRDTGVSSRGDWASLLRRFREERRVHRKYADANRFIYEVYWALYMPYRRMRSLI